MEENSRRIPVLISGATGRMGTQAVRAICAESDLELVAAVGNTRHIGADAGLIAGIDELGISIGNDLAEAISVSKPRVMVDFSIPSSVMSNVKAALTNKVACVIGATGLTEDDYVEIAQFCEQYDTPVFAAPNFAIGAVLMMQFTSQACKHLSATEIVELHHDKKLDAPSGTALLTAKQAPPVASSLALNDDNLSRGLLSNDSVYIHSLRMPVTLAHQEVIFGDFGQTLTIQHDSIDHESFMPGVILAIRKVQELKGLTIGLEKLL